MLPTVFLSLAGVDEPRVRRVQDFLPDGLAYFYPRSFASGEELVSAMEDRVSKATIFALFASKQSLASCWVGFEIDRARVAKIKNPKTRILVLSIDPDVTPSDLPAWMREYWVGKAGHGPREIARYIRRALISGPLSQLPGNQVYGRGALVDLAIGVMNAAVLRTEQTPNVVVLAGNIGIGRRTFGRKLLMEAFPSTPDLNYGPEFQLPQFADLADLYRALRQEIETTLSFKGLADDLRAFAEAPITTQAAEVARKMSHFGVLGQAVTVISGNGIYEDKGFLKIWVPELFRQLEKDRPTKLVIVSTRLLHENELRAHPNVMQLQVPRIDDADIRTLMIGSATALGVKPELPSKEVIHSIGGHPGIARATAALIARKGPAVVNSDLRDLFNLQEDVLSESLNFDNLSEIEKDVLSTLSWVQQLSGDMLKEVILKRYKVSAETFAETVSGLILACLVEVSGANYLISGPIRALFRRLHGYGSTDLMTSFSSVLRDALSRARETDELRAELIDAVAYMAAIEGGSLPTEFRSLLLPSTLQEIVRDTYDRGHDDVSALKRVAAWGLPAMKMNMDETTREEILSYVVRAQIRLGEAEDAEKLLAFLDERKYRSRYYLRSFYVRFHKHDLKKAIELLKKAREVKKYMGRVVGDLAICYQRLGMWSDLHQLVRDEERHADRNPVLLNVRIGMLIAQNDFEAAEKAIRTLRNLPREEASADSRAAMIMMRREQDYRGAQAKLTAILERGSGGHISVRRLRAIAAASAGDLQTARADADFLKARRTNYSAHDLEARIKLAQRDYDGAERELDNAPSRSVQDELLRARILEAKAADALTPFADRERLRQKAEEIRASNRMLDEYEVEG
jgi:hypothetical protein